jgi:hypothetical protein
MKSIRNKYLFQLILSIATCCSISISAYAQDIPKELYSSAEIPDSLKMDANSIVRYSVDEVTIKGPGEAVIKHHKLVTILNEKGDKEAIVMLFYNKKYDTFSDIVFHIYDGNGLMIKKYHKSDMYDGAAINDETIVSDDRFLGLRHVPSSYPTTIEIEYEEDLSSFISMDNWHIQNLEQAVENETYIIKAKPETGVRYRYKNISLKPVAGSEDGLQTYTWHVKNIKAIKDEDEAPGWSVIPYVLFGTNNFDCYGVPGDISSWGNFGKWIYSLNKDVCTLSPQRVADIKKMTDTIKTDKAKAKFLYKYMQQSMRYVSVQLGIGGYKPFDANFVDTKKYGDCKALANYMYALLNAVNIPSYWAVIKAGANESAADPDFPNNSFNHEILCIPFKNDTTWLECTSSTQSFGQLGAFTENRNALLITQDGGKLVNTPKSTAFENQFNSEIHMVIDSDGSAKAQVKILTTGGYRDDYVAYLPNLKTDDQKQELMHMLNIRQPTVFDYNPGTDNNGTKEVDLNLEYDRFCDIIAGNKQFYRPRVFDLCAFTVPATDKRKSDYYFQFPLQKTCVTTIDLPPGFEVETLPASQSLKFTYGNYEISYVYNAAKNEVVSKAKFSITKHVIPAAKYTELQQYLDAIAKAQNKKLVIRKKA